MANGDVEQFRFWLKNTMSYLILLQKSLEPSNSENILRLLTEQQMQYVDRSDLRFLTERVISNYNKLLLAYQDEIGEENKTLMEVVKFNLAMMYANQ